MKIEHDFTLGKGDYFRYRNDSTWTVIKTSWEEGGLRVWVKEGDVDPSRISPNMMNNGSIWGSNIAHVQILKKRFKFKNP